MEPRKKTPEGVKLGEQVKALRKERDLSEEGLGQQCGVSDSSISKLENGWVAGSVEWLLKLAGVFGRELGFVDRLLPYRLLPHREVNWGQVIHAAHTRLRAAGFALTEIAGALRVPIFNKIMRSDHFSAMLTLNDPLVPTAKLREGDERVTDAKSRMHMAEITLQLLDLKKDLAKLERGDRLIVKHVKAYPTIAVVVVDNDLYAYFYPFRQRGTESPILEFRGYEQAPSELANFFLEHLKQLEEKSYPPDEKKLRKLIVGGEGAL
ncbi:MAG: helix-turn-helix transcriptional regulator [Nitrospinae bacterium]|nr:helix-turn-helix transcriptional regulator [Nitrospinota bacterium]